MEEDVRITAEPAQNPAVCKLVIDRPVYPDGSAWFNNLEKAKEAPLAEALLSIEGMEEVLISHDTLTLTKNSEEPWQVLARTAAMAVRDHIRSGKSAVSDTYKDSLPPSTEIMVKIQDLLEQKLNPSLASHGGMVELLDVKENNIFIRMGGGCQGCGMADVTLKQGIEKLVRQEVPEVGGIFDTTDHAAGRNPYYAPSAK
ncbi:MAG: NifU family protein [Planctomycetota bacterium]|nr:NifU family protein [Planctomycetota bacterium]